MEPDELRRIVIANIRRLAAKKTMSLNKLADFAGIDRSGLYQVLREDVAVTTDRLCRLANALEVEPWELLKESDEPEE